jgi:hypothetical protein
MWVTHWQSVRECFLYKTIQQRPDMLYDLYVRYLAYQPVLMTSLTVDEASDYLKDYDTPVVIALHGRFSEGWFFHYQSRKHLETGEFST